MQKPSKALETIAGSSERLGDFLVLRFQIKMEYKEYKLGNLKMNSSYEMTVS